MALCESSLVVVKRHSRSVDRVCVFALPIMCALWRFGETRDSRVERVRGARAFSLSASFAAPPAAVGAAGGGPPRAAAGNHRRKS
jgi:hypothetical protein